MIVTDVSPCCAGSLGTYRVQNDGDSQCRINRTVPGDLAWLCHRRTAALTTGCRPPACLQRPGRPVLTHTHTPNPTVYRYTPYRLNTRPGEGMTECDFPSRTCVRKVHVEQDFFFSLCFCVSVCFCACVASTGGSPLLIR